MSGEFFAAVLFGQIVRENRKINAEPPVRFRAQ
jgi:hypothetical protein